MVGVYVDEEADYVSNVINRTYPVGLDTQVFGTDLLARVDSATDDPADREHVSLYIYQHPELFLLRNVESGLPARYAQLRLTVDTVEDFGVVKAIYERLYPTNPAFTTADVLTLCDQRASDC